MNAADLHFLVVEDHVFQRELMVSVLTSMGARHVIEADNGRGALEVLHGRSRPVDIIIIDLEMPGMDGMEFIRHIGEARLPVAVVLTSAHDRALLSSAGTMTEAYGIQLLGIVEKPLTAQELAALTALYEVRKVPEPEPAGVAFSQQDILAALTARHFEPVFQPKVEISTGLLKGAEALARWKHPDRGAIGPYAFIAAMEANECIDDLTWIMLEKAAAACHDWREDGLELTVAVNLSLASLTKIGCAERITEIVRAQGLDPRHMILEVTETIAMTNIAHALENLVRLRIRGFGLAIDDYGTGYSSMQQLARIPFTELKIDQSFVMHACEKPSCKVIVESSVNVASKLGLRAVAEGVERASEWDLLKRLGCDIAQGYFIAAPMESAQLVAWARGWAPPGVHA